MQEQQGNLIPKLSGLPGPRPYDKRGKMKNKQQQLAEFLGTAIGMLGKTKAGRGAIKSGLKAVNKAKRTKAGKKISNFAKTDLGGAVVGNVATAAPGWALGKVQQMKARKQAEAEERRRMADEKKRKRSSAWEDGDIEKEEMNEEPTPLQRAYAPLTNAMRVGKTPTSSGGANTAPKNPKSDDEGGMFINNKLAQQAWAQAYGGGPKNPKKERGLFDRGVNYLRDKQNAELDKQKSGYYTKGRVQASGVDSSGKPNRPASDFYRTGASVAGTGRRPTKAHGMDPSGMGRDLRRGAMRSRGHFQKLKEGTVNEASVMSVARGIGTSAMGSVRPGIDVPTNSPMGRAARQSRTPSGTGRGRRNAPSQNPVRRVTVSDGGAAQRRRDTAKTKRMDPLARRDRNLDQYSAPNQQSSFANPDTGRREKFPKLDTSSVGKKAPSAEMRPVSNVKPKTSGEAGKTPTTSGGSRNAAALRIAGGVGKMASGVKVKNTSATAVPKAEPPKVSKTMKTDTPPPSASRQGRENRPLPANLQKLVDDKKRRDAAGPKPLPKLKPQENWGEYGPGGYGTGNRLGPSMRQRRDQTQRGADRTGSAGAQREADRLTNLNKIRRDSMPQWERDMEDANQARYRAIEDGARRGNQRRRGGIPRGFRTR